MANEPTSVLRIFGLALLTLALPGVRGLRAQPDACNAPAVDSIVQLDMPGAPFEPVMSPDGCWIFVTLAQAGGAGRAGIAVVHRTGGALSVVRTVPLRGNPTGAVLTHDGKLLIVADGGYVAFLDADKLESGTGDPVLGYMGNGSAVAFIYANVTSDDKYAFVAAERARSILVIDLARARLDGFSSRAAIAKLDAGNAPIAVTLSPDDRLLYTTSEAGLPAWGWTKSCKPENPDAPGAALHAPGAIIVFDVAKAIADPTHAELSRVAVGCNPVRLALSPSGDVAYVSVRSENSLVALDAAKLVTDTAHALLGRTQVGIAPVGVAVIDSGARVVVTNSNRFGGSADDRQPLVVVDAHALRAGRSAALDTIPAGAFPRELCVTPDGRTLVATNFASRTLEMIDLARAARARH